MTNVNRNKDIIQWESIDLSTRQEIEEFYKTLWNNNVLRLIKDDQNVQDKMAKAYEKSKAINQKVGLNVGFTILNWNPSEDSDDNSTVSISPGAIDVWDLSPGEPVDVATNTILDHIILCECNDFIPIFSVHAPTSFPHGVNLVYKNKSNETREVYVNAPPFSMIATGVDPSLFEEVKERGLKRDSANKGKKALEKVREDDLYDWLRIQGIDVERQVKTSNNQYVDLWIPGKMIIEIKRAAVSGNDVCQCIDYASEYSLPILIIGEKITGSASRGLAAFNRLCTDRKILFISWDIAYDYLQCKLFRS
jgi:hypothetical protein